MRPLFPPSTGRTSPRAEEVMEELLQSGVRAEPGTLHHAMFSTVASELDRATSRFLRQDPRPWRADVLREGAAETADSEREEVPLWEMIYGPPNDLIPIPVRKYPYDHKAGAYGITGEDGQVVQPAGIGRAVETRDGLFVQAGGSLYRLDGEPEEVSIDHTPAAGAGRWALASGSETRRSLLLGEPGRREEVAAQIVGTDLQVRGSRRDAELACVGIDVVRGQGERVPERPKNKRVKRKIRKN